MVIKGFGTATTNCTASTIARERLWRPPKYHVFDSYDP